MKIRIVLVALVAMMIAFGATAQEKLISNTSNIVSPAINPDHTVTFKVHAPKASRVILTGDFLPKHKILTSLGEMESSVDMIENRDGVWEYTTAPLESELYTYRLIANGQQIYDPSNVYQLRDIATYSNYFIVGDGKADVYKVQEVPHGTIAKVWYPSNHLDLKMRRMTVYTCRL